MKMPVLFLSHGAPTLAVERTKETDAWATLAQSLPRPRAILAVSAHWDTSEPAASLAPQPETIHDFHGFPRALYEQRYPAPGAPEIAREAASMLTVAGIACALDPQRGLDHGAWVPLKWMYPAADIPVTQLSVQSRRSPRHHYEMGRALAGLRDENVLVLATGGIVHNLRDLEWDKRGTGEAAAWAKAFNDWIAARVESQSLDELLAYRDKAPHAQRSHPSEDHFDPFFVALGAGGLPARRIDLGFDMGTLGMDGYVFGAAYSRSVGLQGQPISMAQKRSLYEILGIAPDANELDVGLAYERRKEQLATASIQDPNESSLVQQAYEILSNPKRRAAYDASRVTAAEKAAAAAQAKAPDLVVESGEEEAPARPKWIMPGVLAVVILIVVGFFVLRPTHAPEKAAEAPPPAPKPEPPPPPQPMKPAQLLEAALRASGQLLRYDMSGSGVPIGMAVSLEPGSVVTTCHGIAAGSKVVFRQGADTLSTELTVDDEILDLCKLAVPGVSSRTLAVATDEAKAGDKVYALGVNAKGEPALTEGKVRGVKMAESVKVLDLDVPIAATGSGGPVLNEFGKVVGIASTPHRYGAGVNAAISSGWLSQMRSRAKAAG